MPTVDFYSKSQVDALIAGAGGLPDPTSASAGDVLTLDSNKDPAWVAPSSGGITLIGTYGGNSASTANYKACHDAIVNLPDDHIYLIENIVSNTYEQFIMSKIGYYHSGSQYEYLCLGGSQYYASMDITKAYRYSRVECNNNQASVFEGTITGTTVYSVSAVPLYHIRIYQLA